MHEPFYDATFLLFTSTLNYFCFYLIAVLYFSYHDVGRVVIFSSQRMQPFQVVFIITWPLFITVMKLVIWLIHLRNTCLNTSITRMMKSGMRWVEHVVLLEEMRSAYKILVGKPEGMRPLGRFSRMWKSNIKTDLG